MKVAITQVRALALAVIASLTSSDYRCLAFGSSVSGADWTLSGRVVSRAKCNLGDDVKWGVIVNVRVSFGVKYVVWMHAIF